MDVTLRLTSAQAAALTRLAAAEGVTEHEAAIRAIEAEERRLVTVDEVERATQETMRQYANLFARLADT